MYPSEDYECNANVFRDIANNEQKPLKDLIVWAFIWGRTPEGFDMI